MPPPPVRPDSFDKVNFVIDSWVTGCDAPWYIYIETMKPAALEAFIVLITFGWADVLRGAFRPKGLGRRSSKRKGRWARHRGRFPEVGNTLGKALPFAEQIEDFIKWGSNTKMLWRIDNAMQAGLFFWLVADVAEDFAFNWTSLLYESYWCQPDPPGRFSYSSPGLSPKSAGIWWKGNYAQLDYQHSPPSWSFRTGFSGPKGCSAAATNTWSKLEPYPAPINTGIRIYDLDNGKILALTAQPEAGPDGTTTLVAKADIQPNTRFGVAIYHEPSWCFVGDGIVMGVETVDR